METKRVLKVNFNNETLPFYTEPKYFGVTLDMPRTYRRHRESLPSSLAGIQPAELRCNGATLSLARRAMEPGHQLHSALTCSSSMPFEINRIIHLYPPHIGLPTF